MSSSTPSNDWYISVFAFGSRLHRTPAMNADYLIIDVSVSEGLISSELIRHRRLGGIILPKMNQIDAYSRWLLRSSATDQGCQTGYPHLHRLVANVIQKSFDCFKIVLPLTSERIFSWGVRHGSSTTDGPELKTQFEIMDLLARTVREAAKKETSHVLHIQIRKLETVSAEEYMKRVPGINEDDDEVKRRENPLAGWILEMDRDLDYHRYYEGFLIELCRKAPKDNRFFGLKSVKVKKGECPDPVCPICLKDMKVGSQVIQLPCSDIHSFHGYCILDWLKMKPTCPVCRFQVHNIRS